MSLAASIRHTASIARRVSSAPSAPATEGD